MPLSLHWSLVNGAAPVEHQVRELQPSSQGFPGLKKSPGTRSSELTWSSSFLSIFDSVFLSAAILCAFRARQTSRFCTKLLQALSLPMNSSHTHSSSLLLEELTLQKQTITSLWAIWACGTPMGVVFYFFWPLILAILVFKLSVKLSHVFLIIDKIVNKSSSQCLQHRPLIKGSGLTKDIKFLVRS